MLTTVRLTVRLVGCTAVVGRVVDSPRFCGLFYYIKKNSAFDEEVLKPYRTMWGQLANLFFSFFMKYFHTNWSVPFSRVTTQLTHMVFMVIIFVHLDECFISKWLL